MKPSEEREAQQLAALSGELGVTLTDEQATMLLVHLDEVLEWNARLNLTAITSREKALLLHVVDSVAAVRGIDVSAGPIADLGSGAGYPGIPVSVVTQNPVALIESIRKKASFLEHIVARLRGLYGSEVLPLRAEEVAFSLPEHFGTVLARAVAPLASLVELASPLLRVGGRLVAMKGSPSHEERMSGSDAAARVGMREIRWEEYALPGAHDHRTVAVYEKVEKSSIDLPRRIGLAQKRPLA